MSGTCKSLGEGSSWGESGWERPSDDGDEHRMLARPTGKASEPECEKSLRKSGGSSRSTNSHRETCYVAGRASLIGAPVPDTRRLRRKMPALTSVKMRPTGNGSMNVIATFINGFLYISLNLAISTVFASICACVAPDARALSITLAAYLVSKSGMKFR